MPGDTLKDLRVRLGLRDKAPGKLTEKELQLVYRFTSQLVKDFGGFIQAVLLFGSVSRGEAANDVDLLVVVDDAQFKVTPEIIGSYKLGVGKIIVDLGAEKVLHITTIGLVDFWDGIRHSDPVLFTIVRDCQPIVDTGFVKPVKKLLEMGRIRPSREAIEVHLQRAKALDRGADMHLLIAADDLYWACIDAAHAVLMAYGLTPEEPGKVARVFRTKLAKKVKIPKKYVETLEILYRLMKRITKKKLRRIEPVRLASLMKRTDEFVLHMERVVRKAPKKKCY